MSTFDTRLAVDFAPPTTVKGLPQDALEELHKCWKVWAKHLDKNQLLNTYYDGHRAFEDLGIAIPPQMRKTRAALGWPAKAVTALARKHVFEGYSLQGQTDAFDVAGLLNLNAFEAELAQAITSAYKHSCAFLTVTKGDESAGEPPVVIQARDAAMSAAVWDQRSRAIRAFLAIDAWDEAHVPSGMVLYTRAETWRLERNGLAGWAAQPMGNNTGRLLVEPIIYDPQLGRPFGRSRITREVRYLTDAAIRTLVRAEASAEFFASPQRYVLGVDPDAFADKTGWEAIIGRLQVLTYNENGENPSVGQFPQMSMSPHLEMYRQLAQNFCAATNLPQSAVGLFADNPASAEAMQAAEAALADEAEAQWRIFTGPLRGLLADVLAVRDGVVSEEVWDTDVRWTPARYASPAASADFAVKMVQAFPELASSRVLMRRAGLTETDLAAIDAEARTAQSAGVLAQLQQLADAERTRPPEPDQGQEPAAEIE